MKQVRQANFELLRIVAILLISMMHGIRSAYGSTYLINDIAHVIVTAIGNMGVTLFVLIAGFFSIKLRPSKVLWLWSVVLFYSLFIFAFHCIDGDILFEEGNIRPFIKEFYWALTPFSTGTWWFISSYMILLLLSPLFNKAADCISRIHFIYLLFILLCFYSLSPTILLHSFTNEPCGKSLQNMIFIYFIGRYIAKYGMPSIIRENSIFILLCCITIIFVVNFFIFDPLFMSKDNNLLIIIGSICVFQLFSKLSITGEQSGKTIRYIATYAFPIYLLNTFLLDLLEPYYIGFRESWKFLFYYVLSQCIIICISFVIELIRRPLMSPINSNSKHLDNYCREWYSKLETKINAL